jgi:hypothetical protein
VYLILHITAHYTSIWIKLASILKTCPYAWGVWAGFINTTQYVPPAFHNTTQYHEYYHYLVVFWILLNMYPQRSFVILPNTTNTTITTRFLPLLQDFCTWLILKNRPLLRKARGQIGAVDVSEFFGAVFVFACWASLRSVSPVMIEGTKWGKCILASGTLVSSMLGEPENRPALFLDRWHLTGSLSHVRFPSQSRPLESILRGRGCCFPIHERGRRTYSRHSSLYILVHPCAAMISVTTVTTV